MPSGTPSTASGVSCAPVARRRAWRIVSIVIKALVSIGVLAWLIRNGRFDFPSTLPMGRLWTLPCALTCAGAALALQAWRWRRIVRAQVGEVVSFGAIFKLTLIGTFFNCFLLGSTGGDLVKAAYLGKTTGRPVLAVATVGLDRAIGLLGLLLLPAGALLLWGGFGRLDAGMAGVVPVVGVAAGGLLVLLLTCHRWLGWMEKGRCWVQERLFRKAAAQERLVPLGLGEIVRLASVSVVAQSLLVLGTFLVWKLLAGDEASAAMSFAFVPLSHLANAVPISLGGLGVGEGALDRLFALAGSAHGAAVFLVFRSVMALWAVAGAAAYMGLRWESRADAPATAQAGVQREGLE